MFCSWNVIFETKTNKYDILCMIQTNMLSWIPNMYPYTWLHVGKKAFLKMNQLDNIDMIYVYKVIIKYVLIKICAPKCVRKLHFISTLPYSFFERNILNLYIYVLWRYFDCACIVIYFSNVEALRLHYTGPNGIFVLTN